MKKAFSLACLAMVCLAATAQNVQLHYDLGHTLNGNLSNRQSVTTTVEMFRADTWGSTFFFIDLDYQRDGMAGAYWEIAREFSLVKGNTFAAHVEYNGGLTSDETTWNATRFQHNFLVGPAWNWHNADFSRTFSLQAMYKHFFKNGHWAQDAFSSFQLTAVWGMKLAKGWMDFSGFADVWYHKDVQGKLIFLSEPQLWVNLNKAQGWENVNLSLGAEVELSNNFVYNVNGANNRFYAIPTVAAKWTF